MMRIRVEDVERDPRGYLRRVEAGETLLIVRADKTIAEVRPVEPEYAGLRPFGLCAGEFTVPDDFDAPLPDELLREFEGR